ncbi:MAG: hypothetical protein KDG89_14095 [Geminicoccaceae bacterium]|nr:hypothetical protein [Geminicoccaceae bacterium]
MFSHIVILAGAALGGLAVLPVARGERGMAVGTLLLAGAVLGIGVQI